MGASGFSYKEWKGSFYPAGTKDADMLRLYAAELAAVEINATFYRMPKASVLEGWGSQVPEHFRFALKASQRITHRQKLEDVADSVDYLWKNAQVLGPKLGPILYQLPPFLRRDDERLKRFFATLPSGQKAVMEFRHRSWFDETIFACLREHGVGLCFSDTDPSDEDDPGLDQPFVSTAAFGYVRLRRAAYDEAALDAWNARMKALPVDELFVFFKHEPTAPALALALRARF